MKRYDLILKLSCINDLLVLIAQPYITAQTWADIIFLLFIISSIYQLVYIFYLRKKDNIKFGKSIANLILYFTYTIYAFIIYRNYDVYVSGYSIGFLDEFKTSYGIDALKDFYGSLEFIFVTLPSFIICFVYQIIYYFVNKKIKDKKIEKKETTK